MTLTKNLAAEAGRRSNKKFSKLTITIRVIRSQRTVLIERKRRSLPASEKPNVNYQIQPVSKTVQATPLPISMMALLGRWAEVVDAAATSQS